MTLPMWLVNNALWLHGGGIIVVLFTLALATLLWWRPGIWLIIGFFVFSLYFFRVPDRALLNKKGEGSFLICPADGRIVEVLYDKNHRFNGHAWKIAIFLSPLDAHVNWMPVDCCITRIVYHPGSFVPAFLPKSSEQNEHVDLYLCAQNGKSLIVRQIAGFVARRIVCWVHEGDCKRIGELYGMIRFGSRVEVLLPESVIIDVGVGQRVYGGQTILGRWV